MTLRMAHLFAKTTADRPGKRVASTTAGTKFVAVPSFQMAGSLLANGLPSPYASINGQLQVASRLRISTTMRFV
jgi:hypothetical protein